MLTPHQIASIIRYSDEGLSQRSICTVTGVSRKTVRRVIARRRRYRKLRFPMPELTPDDFAELEPAVVTGEEVQVGAAAPAEEINELKGVGLYNVPRRIFTRPPQRCPGCGATCYMPCLACRVRQHQRRRK